MSAIRIPFPRTKKALVPILQMFGIQGRKLFVIHPSSHDPRESCLMKYAEKAILLYAIGYKPKRH